MRDNWLASDMLYEEDGEVYGLTVNLETVLVGKVEDVRAAMGTPEDHPEMWLKLEAVGVDVSENEEEGHGTDKTSRDGLDGSRVVRAARRKRPSVSR